MENDSSIGLNEILKSIKYCWDSKKGKYSLDTYLDIIGEYADRQIIEAEKDALKYIGGECSVKKEPNDKSFLEFHVQLFFVNQEGESVEKEAKRMMQIAKFVGETADSIGNETLKFKINKPGGKS